MTETDEFEYVRQADFGKFASLAADERYKQELIGPASGDARAAISRIRTPAGGGSPEGLHTHPFEQIFYVLDGAMSVEIDGRRFDVGPGSVVIFPEGVPHRNWTTNPDEPTAHLAINIPRP